MKDQRLNLLASAAAISGFLAIGFGAFGAHAFAGVLSEQGSAWWETATQYALPHAAAAFAASLSARPAFRLGGWVLLGGSALFAATLYALALGAPRALGMVTPIGGVAMLAGWCVIAAAGLRRA